MADVEVKETPVVDSTPAEKEVEKVSAEEESSSPVKELNGSAAKENGVEAVKEPAEEDEEEDEEEEEVKTAENGDSNKETPAVKRKSEVGTTDESSVDAATPEKKAKLDEKVENGEAEAKA